MRYVRVLLGILFLAIAALTQAAVSSAQGPEPILPLTDPMAAFLEPRALGVQKGATAEFNKMEWVAVDSANKKIYYAMSDVTGAMTDDKGSIKVPENRCGVVYVGNFDDKMNVTNIKPLISGGPYNKEAKGDKCDVNNISNPDALMVDSKGQLWIGEDTSNHVNNVLWMWDGQKLNRFATLPVGAEVTGLFITKQDNLFFNAQHPSAMNPYPFNRASVGVVNGFKATDTFKPVGVPAGDDMKKVAVAAGQYQPLARVGESIPNDIYAQRFGQIDNVNGSLELVCNHPDGNMFLPTNSNGTEGYLYTNYECRPGGVSKIYIRNDGSKWQVLEGENVDFSSVKGTWNNCGASVTPWNTGMTSEEYEPIATKADWQKNVTPMTSYLGKQSNPFDYGYLVELAPDTKGDEAGTRVTKHYAMGRFSHEMGAIMPDNKTVYHGDDGANVMLFKFVADEAGDLSAGTLYAGKVTQKADNSFDLEWIELGKGSDEEIGEYISTMKLPQ